MKIMNLLTLRYLKENKKRTILTILCISVSVIMISCVGIAFYSGQQFYKEYVEKTTGDYHYTFVSNNKKFIDIVKNDKDIEEYYFSSTEPYYADENLKEETFLSMKSGDSLYFQKQNYQDFLIEGKLPSQYGEIVISQKYLNSNHLQKKIGDTISLYNNEYHKKYNYKIVGIINNYDSQNIKKQSFQAISYINHNEKDAYYTLYVKDKDVSTHIFDHAYQLGYQLNQLTGNNVDEVRYNSSYLAIQNIFEENSSSIFLGVYMLVGVILVIILMISIFIIYQAFNLSTNDRIQYLGMLSSVGATPKQKRKSIYFEGMTLSMIAIPLGIIISFIGLSITFYFISQLEAIQSLNLGIYTKISLPYMLAIIVVSLITIFISLYLPARKIAKISVIDALKKNDDLKVKSKSLKTNQFSQHFFNVYQNLAIKNYKRQKRRSRVIVFSLIISMIAFVSIYSFGHYFLYEMNQSNRYNSCDVSLNIADDPESIEKLNQILSQNDKVDSYYYLMNLTVYSNTIDKSYINIPLDNIDEYSINILGIDNQKFKEICKDNDVEYKDNQALLYNGSYIDYNTGKTFESIFNKMDHNFIKSLYILDDEYDANENLIKHSQTDLDTFQHLSLVENVSEIQNQINSWYSQINMIVPIDYLLNIEKDSHYSIEYNIFSSEHQELTKELESLDYSAQDYAQSVLENRQIFLIIQIFVYGFVFIMILFTMLNIMNMMSASIDNRKKELGMMLSVGMSPKGITRMLFYESFIYGLKTLVYGVPICIGVEWLLYKQVSASELSFVPSFVAYLISFVVIMIVMTLTFQVGLHKFRKQNIIETLKDDM